MQRPFLVRAQLLPVPQSAFSQHTPSVQESPEGQEALVEQESPTPARGTHFRLTGSQNSTDAQSGSAVHSAHLPVGWHLPVAQTAPVEQASPIASVPTHPVPLVSHTCGATQVAVQQRLPTGDTLQVPAPAAHARSSAQTAPVETLGLHAPASQNAVVRQSPSDAQVVLQPAGATQA